MLNSRVGGRYGIRRQPRRKSWSLVGANEPGVAHELSSAERQPSDGEDQVHALGHTGMCLTLDR